MVGKRSPFTDQNTVLYQEPLNSWYTGERYINEICLAYGNNELSFSSVTRWCKKFKSGVDSVEDAPHARRPKTAQLRKK